jgi:hypothetical protein
VAYHRAVRVAVTLGLLAATLAAPAGAAAGSFRPLATGKTAATSDGERFVAWQSDQFARTYILDTRTGQRFQVTTPTIRYRAQPPPPPPPGYPPPPDPEHEYSCGLGGVGSGLLLWDCGFIGGAAPLVTPWGARLLDLRTRTPVPVHGEAALRRRYPDAEAFGFVGVGRRWLTGYTKPAYGGRRFFLDWRTGRVVDDGRAIGPSPLPGHQVRDLDNPTLNTTLCAPLRRRETEAAPYRFDFPFGLSVRRPPRFGAYGALVLDRCGRRARTIVRWPGWGGQELGSGVVSWQDGSRAMVLHAATGRRASVSFAGLPRGASTLPELQHTATRLVLSLASQGPTYTWTLYTAPLP